MIQNSLEYMYRVHCPGQYIKQNMHKLSAACYAMRSLNPFKSQERKKSFAELITALL
jgi:hypothetical protein